MISAADLLEVLKVLTIEQRLELAESLPIPSWIPGTTTTDGISGTTIEVLLDRDLETTATISAKNITGGYIASGTRVMVRSDGGVRLIDAVLSASTYPPGVLVGYGGDTEPAWGVFANGQTLANAPPYDRLAAALGLTGSTFTVPNAEDRVILFKSSGTTLLAVGGAFSRTIAQANLPAYNLTVTDPGHRHDDGDDTLANSAAAGSAKQEPGAGTAGSKRTGYATTGITVASGGSGTALDTTPKHIILNPVWTL